MTIVDITQQPPELAPRPEFEPPVEREVTIGQVTKAFFEKENLVHAFGTLVGDAMFSDFIPDSEYDPYQDMTGYESYVTDLGGAQSRGEMSSMKNKIDEELEMSSVISSGSFGQQLLGMGVAIASDPTTMIPIGGQVYKSYRVGGRILEGAGRTAVVAAAVETGREVFLQQAQITRTFEESAANVAAVTLLSGLLGGAAAGLSRNEFAELAARMDRELITPKDFDTSLSTVGAAEVGTTSVQEEIKGLKKTLKAFGKLPDFLTNPVLRTVTSPSKKVRIFSEKIADSSLIKNKNTEFIATEQSIETHVKSYNLMKANFYIDMDKNWRSYKGRIKQQKLDGGIPTGENLGSKPDGSMTYQEFAEQVGMANARNDEHIIKEIADTAQSARKNVFDPILKRSKEVGIFDDIDELDVKTADTWVKRMYNVEKIIAERDEFKRIVLDDLISKRQISIDELAILNRKHGDNIFDLQELQFEKNQFRKKNFGKITKGDEVVLSKLEDFDARLSKIAATIPDKDVLKKIDRLTFRASNIDEELENIAEQIIDRVTNATGGRLPYDNKLVDRAKAPPGKVGLRGSAKARVWDIKDELVEPYLIRDINAIVDSHIRTMAPDNEIMAKFGTLDTDIIKKSIQEDYIRLRESKRQGNPELQNIDLEKRMKKDMGDIQAMLEKLRGLYAQPDDYTAFGPVFERTAMAWNFVRLLGDVVASSLSDIGRHVMVNGFGRVYKNSIKSMIKDMKGFKASIAEAKEMGTTIDLTLSTTALKRAHMDEYSPVISKLDSILNKTATFFANAIGINHWNSFQKTFAGITVQNRMLDAIIDFSKGKKVPIKEIENLASHGIGKDEALRIAKQFSKHGEVREVVKLANARAWDDVAIRNTFQNAIRKQIDEIIVTPGLDRPLWVSKLGWRIIGQFKSFSFTSMQRVSLAGLQQADANVFSGLSVMVVLGMQTYAWKTIISGRELSDDPRVWLVEGVDRSGITGWFFDVNNISEKITGGRVGINALIGGPPMSRYASRNAVGALLGPSYGLGQDVFRITGAAFRGDFSASDTHAARRLFPFQNVPYLRGIFDTLETTFNETLGIAK